MIAPNIKLNVFISSMCGDNDERRLRYNLARSWLRDRIESTGFADVYLFEADGSSPGSASDEYRTALLRSDICIFFIDNEDGVPEGVQVEIDEANKHSIKSFYYFCDETKKEKTLLQQSLLHANCAKSTTVHSFEAFCQQAAQDFINHIAKIYKGYCKPIQALSESSGLQATGNVSSELMVDAAYTIPIGSIEAVDLCKHYFFSMFPFYFHTEEQHTCELDKRCARFLPILFEGKTIEDFNVSLFWGELEHQQTSALHSVVKTRWEAIQNYFLDNLQACVAKLKDAYDQACKVGLPTWFLQDILIDLRNFQAEINNEKNIFWSPNIFGQQELKRIDRPLVYPFLDRLNSNFYQNLLDEQWKEESKSLHTVTIEDPISKFIDPLAKLFVTAMYYGSLTELLLIKDHLKRLALYLSRRFSDWKCMLLLLKLSVLEGRLDTIDRYTRVFPQVLPQLNANEALEIYLFCSNEPTHTLRFKAQLAAYYTVGYYLDDTAFTTVTFQLFEEIRTWLEDDHKSVTLINNAFKAIRGVVVRLSQNDWVGLCCDFWEKGFIQWEYDYLELLSQYIDVKHLSSTLFQRLFHLIEDSILKDASCTQLPPFYQLIIVLRKQNKDMTHILDEFIAEKKPVFYSGTYRIDTTDDPQTDYPDFFKKYVKDILKANATQGVDGHYSYYTSNPYQTLQNLMQNESVSFSDDLIDNAFIAAGGTLLAPKQLLSDKCCAADLLVFLCLRYPNVIARNPELVARLSSANENLWGNAYDGCTNLTEVALRFAVLLLYHCFKKNVLSELLMTLAEIQQASANQIRAARSLLVFVQSYSKKGTLPTPINTLILQQAIYWDNSSILELRALNMKLLFALLINKENLPVIQEKLVQAIECGHAVIKCQILAGTVASKAIDDSTRNYVYKKCAQDVNFAVRNRYHQLVESSPM